MPEYQAELVALQARMRARKAEATNKPPESPVQPSETDKRPPYLQTSTIDLVRLLRGLYDIFAASIHSNTFHSPLPMVQHKQE